MKIGLFSDTFEPEINGVASSISTLKNELEKNNHEVFVITTKHGLFDIEFNDNILRLPGIELNWLYGYVLTSPMHFLAIKKIKDMQLDIIHAHTEFGVGIFSRIVAKHLNIPLVSTYHTTYEDYTHYVNKFNFKRVDVVAKKAVSSLSKLYSQSSVAMIAPSQKTKDMLQGYNIKTDIKVIPTGLDLVKFNKNQSTNLQIKEIREKFNFTKEDFVVVFVGRIAKEKSIDIVIDGFSEIAKINKNIKLLIVGDGPEKIELESKVDSLDLNDQIYFAGKVPSNQVPSYYHSCQAFVSASLTETQGMTYIEALASELIVFARHDEVIKDLIVEDKTGYLFTDCQEFAAKVIKYAKLCNLDKEIMKKQAIEKVEKYDSNVFYNRVIELYEKAIITYNDYYMVNSIKDKDGYVELKLKKNDESFKVCVHFDTYLNLNIRKNTMLSDEDYNELLEQETLVLLYEKCLRKLAIKDRTRKEMYDWITQKFDLNIKDINDIIELLETKGYIDDRKYAYSAVFNFKKNLVGEIKIFRELKKKGVSVDIIDEAIKDSYDTELEMKNAIKFAEKINSSNRNVSNQKMKDIIRQKLINNGFNHEVCSKVIEILSIEKDEKNERSNLASIATKAKKRYSHKYCGVELRNRVFRYCSSQRFESSDIFVVLSEMEWEDE